MENDTDTVVEEISVDPFPLTGRMIKVYSYVCTEKPEALLGQPIGMYHCPACGCMVVAGIEHGYCFPGDCVAVDEGCHPGKRTVVEIDSGQADGLRAMLGAVIDVAPDDAIVGSVDGS